MKKFTKLLFFALLFFYYSISLAQQGDTLDIQRNNKNQISFARFKPNENRNIKESERFLRTILKAKPSDEFKLIKENTDKYGVSHRKYQQYYKGIKIENAEYLVHGKNNLIETINGNFEEVTIASVTPSVTGKQALTSAMKYVHASKYKWEDESLELNIKKVSGNPQATYFPTGELVITKDELKKGNNLRLAWKFKISSLSPNNEQLIYVDAFTNEVIRDIPLIYDVNTPCTAQTLYSGTVGIIGDSFAGGFRLRETRNGVDIQTLNMQNGSNYANAIDFSNTTTNFTNGGWSNFNQNQSALDAHFGAETVLDYWRTVHNRNSIDNNGIRVLGYVHFSPNGLGWSNAQWVGGANNHFMQYGDGDGFFFNPLTALDITAHEIGHGINEFEAALSPGTQESGALNEGFSDIWGACIENWADPAKQTWLLGEEVFISGFSCVRNMQNPKTTTAAEGQHPDTYQGQFWDNNGEPHTNSTVLSHWFFLLAQGGTGTNDLSNAFSVNGIGINDAQTIAYSALTNILNSSANYSDARNATIQAAVNIFGAGSCQEINVTKAWYAVGVGSDYISSLAISGAGSLCSSDTYSISSLPTGATVTWSASGSIGISGSNTANPVTVVKNFDGYGTLSAVINSSCGNYSINPRSIYAGLPVFPSYSTDPSPVCDNEPFTFNPIIPDGQTVTSATGLSGGVEVALYEPTTGSYEVPYDVYRITLTIENSCGSAIVRKLIPKSDCFNLYTVYPNPANSELSVQYSSENGNLETSQDLLSSSAREVKLYDKQGNIMLSSIMQNNKVTFNTNTIPNGIYYLHIVTKDKKIIKRQVIIQH